MEHQENSCQTTHYHTLSNLSDLTIQNCRVLSAACGERLGMRRRHFCDCLAGLHWATICEAMRGNKKWQPRHGRHHAGADIERKDTCGLCQSHGRSYSSFVSQPKLKKHFKTAGSQTQISGQTAINSICSKHEVSDLIFHSLQDAIQEVSNDYSTCAHVSLHKIFKENEQQDEQQKKPPTINPLKRFLHLANML